MTSPAFAGHPFGTVVTEETLRQTFGALNAWEEKYRQLIMLGKQLPAATDEIKAQAQEIPGCENRVWLGSTHCSPAPRPGRGSPPVTPLSCG